MLSNTKIINGSNITNSAALRQATMNRELKEREMVLERREMDRINQEISHKKLDHGRVLTEISRLKQDMARNSLYSKDPSFHSSLRESQSRLNMLMAEERRLSQDIRFKKMDWQRRSSGLHF